MSYHDDDTFEHYEQYWGKEAPPGQDEHNRRIQDILNNLGLTYPGLPSSSETPVHLLLLKLKDSSWQVRARTLRTLEGLDDPIPTQSIEALLRDKHEHEAVRAAAASVLGKQKKGLPVLVSALHDPAWRVRAEVVLALGMMGDQTPTGLLLDRFRSNHEHAAVRTAAVQVLGHQRWPLPTGVLLNALRNEDVLLREATLVAIGQLNGIIPLQEEYKLLRFVLAREKERVVCDTAVHLLEQMKKSDLQELTLIRSIEQRTLRRLRMLVFFCWIGVLGYLSLIAWNLYHLLYLSPVQRSDVSLVEVVVKVVPLGPFTSFSHFPLVYILIAFAFCFVVYSLIKATESVLRPLERGQRDSNGTKELWSLGALTTIPIEHQHQTGNVLLQVCLGLILVVILLLTLCASIWDL